MLCSRRTGRVKSRRRRIITLGSNLSQVRKRSTRLACVLIQKSRIKGDAGEAVSVRRKSTPGSSASTSASQKYSKLKQHTWYTKKAHARTNLYASAVAKLRRAR